MLSRSFTVALWPPRAGLLIVSLSFGLITLGCGGKEENAGPSADAEVVEVTLEQVDDEAAPSEPAESSEEEAAPAQAEPLEKELSEAGSTSDLIAMIDAAAQKRGGGKEMLQQIVGAAESDQAEVRWHAARAIGMIGEDAIAEIPVLIDLLADTDPVVAVQAASAIGMIRADDHRSNADLDDVAEKQYTAATEALVQRIVHPDARVRRVSIRALATLAPPTDMIVPLVAKQLSDEDPSVILPALHTMADAGASAVPFLVDSLNEPKSRYWASVVLAEIGPEAADAVPALLAIAEDAEGEPEERMQAILALAAVGEAAAAAGESLAGLAGNETGPVQFAAVYACGMLRATGASEALENIAAEGTPFLSGIATWGLARIHPDDAGRIAQAFDRLTAALQDENPAVRQASVTGLSDLEDELTDEQRTDLATSLTTMIQDPAGSVREAAAAALVRLGSDAVPALVGLLGQDVNTQRLALELLSTIGPDAAAGFGPALDTFLASDDELVQADAAFVLGAMARGSDAIDAEAAEKAISAMTELVANDATPAEVRYTAVYALGKFGPKASAAAESLRSLAQSDDVLLATVAAWAGLKVEPENREQYEQAIPLLEKALQSERELARLEAAVALGDIGGDAAGSLPILELVSEDDPSRSVRSAAAAAVKKIKAGS